MLQNGATAATPDPGVTVTKQGVETAAGLHVVTFDTLQGTVTVNLPDDMSAGDTISGTVVAEGKGKTPEDQQKNQDSLSGTVVEMEQQKTAASDPGGRGKWIVPAAASIAIPLILKDRQGRIIGKVDIPVAKPQKEKPSKDAFQLPSTGQSGRPVAISGPFDGDFTTSSVSVGGTAIDVLAESPRKLIARAPTSVIGVAQLQVTKGQVVTHCEYRNLSIKLSAPKVDLKSGEKTTMTITVDGAAGMEQSVPLSLVNKSPAVVRVESGDVQTIQVDPRKLTGGTSVTTRGLTGVMPGGFNISASIAAGAIPPARCTTTRTEATTLPRNAQEAPRLESPDTLGSNWDFEEGLTAWTPTGDAFTNQPTLGDNVVAGRVRTDMTLERGGIGGDYWKRIPYPIGHHLDAWVGTNENHPDMAAPLGTVQGDGRTGTLTSGDFPLDDAHRFIAFVVGGGSDVATERVELQVRGENDSDVAALERIVGANRGGASALAALFGGTVNASTSRDGNYVIALTATGQNSEVMRPVVFEVPQTLRGRRGRIRIVDNSGGSWGHINADDFRFASARPPDRPPRVWGFADTHAHPMNDLAFGGNVVQGSLYARDGSPYASESYRRTALPPLFENLNWAELGALAGLLSPFYGGGTSAVPGFPPLGPGAGAVVGEAARHATRPARMGYPDMRSYPGFGQMAGQQMYGEWIRRAYDGGLRLMSALAVNTWVVSSHPVKRAVMGGSQPEDDMGSADVQVADIKAWALRPENRTWVEVALTPAHARRIIHANKLALVIGFELDSMGNFVPNDTWREPLAVIMPADAGEQRVRIAAELDRLYAQGVRQFGPFHYVSGVFGGVAMFQRLFNEVNRKVTGNNVQVVSGEPWGIRYRLDMDSWGLDGTASRMIVTGHGPERHVDPTWEPTRLGHINAMGLSGAGEILFEEMARRGLIIDIDHASYRTTETLLQRARARDYPLLSSHTDFVELGFTGPGDFTHGPLANNDEENFRLFDTTTLGPLRQEGMATRAKVQTIADLGGVVGAIMWLPRRMSWGRAAVPNDCDGSSKTWAQGYQYAVEVTGGRGVALSTDRITLEPRFGPNAAYLLGQETTAMYRRDERRFQQVDAQRNGVRYDRPIREWHAWRFALAPLATGAWEKTPIHYSSAWESRPWEHGDAWTAIAAWAAGRNPRRPDHDIDGGPRVINYAWGLWSANEAEVESDCGLGCLPGTLNERYAAYCVIKRITPNELVRFRGALGIWEQYYFVLRVWDQWQRMSGTNDPLQRHVFGNRDFDVNMDGVAHYGMLPDFLQDVANSHHRPAEVGMYFDPLFRSAESYIQMWEKSRRIAGRSDSDP